ncbi:phosphate regulon sensor histidine kinase PhoR [Ramlibacter tataouinensis]|uniref:Phosphate regulon sensor protein PhoR n=1 Tax=Ramlibacter tataouinensis (strain ATCC BAA-407 / DSM 14655 / LMG 21543 / TTB310) TaxID=365046 RepID=F5Y145_RAMTT|nr:phosphate regulon sensor histidine kinase PhoR [Ramlibacter tataouinensis]AEG93446.1 candidate histidine kinase, classic [Ramlibacter tataouinensis TTB310]
MAWRLTSFLLCQLAAGVLGWWLARAGGAAAGVAAGGLAWLVLDLARGERVLRWLRHLDAGQAPTLHGLWGEVADRARRALRSREQQAQDAQQRLQDILAAIQASPNGVVLLDAAGRIEWCNQTAASHFGIDAQRDLMQLVGNLVREPSFVAYYAGGDYRHEIVIPARSGTAGRPARVSVQLHPYGQGRKLLLSRDVTAVEQAEAMRRDFVANVSHEIRTPLTVLTGFIETLQTLPLEQADRTRYLGLMGQQGARMQTLVNDLLTLSRLEGSPAPGAGEWTPVGALTAQCEQEGRALAQVLGKSHELRFDPAPEVEVAGAQAELLSAMSNLVSNAVRYTPAGGAIHVQWRLLADGGAEFAVRDTGPGVAPEHIPRLTERFYRVDRSRSRETGGTGLGLAIVKHVVQRHGGELRIASAPGAGSTFAIQLPASRLRPAVRPPAETARPATAGR